jgi:hypothetical protein
MLPKIILLSALASVAFALPSYLTDPELNWVSDWKRASAGRRAAAAVAGCPMGGARHARGAEAEPGCPMADAIVARQASTTSMTRGSQTISTLPCFNVYDQPAPTDNPTADGPDNTPDHGYQAPTSNDVRSPCPALK